MGGACSTMGENRRVWRPSHRLMDNIKMNLGKTGLGERDWLDWSGSGYGQMESSCECGNETSGIIIVLRGSRMVAKLVASPVVLSSIVLVVTNRAQTVCCSRTCMSNTYTHTWQHPRSGGHAYFHTGKWDQPDFFVIPFYLQSVLVHSANYVKTCIQWHEEECLIALFCN
jgi:hypothetical protein